jgi:hypothetical protein
MAVIIFITWVPDEHGILDQLLTNQQHQVPSLRDVLDHHQAADMG